MRSQQSIRRLIGSTLVVALALALAGPASAASAPDAWVTTKVKMALLTDEGVSALDVNVDTIDGRVTLHGVVGTPAESAKADQVARGIQGVREVRNLLQVVPRRAQNGMEVSDDHLKERVSATLEQDRVLADSDISVASVHNGVVLLGGKARTLTDAYQAVKDVSRVEGVVHVASEIRTPDALGDAELWRDGQLDRADQARSAARDLWITTEAKMRLMANTETPAFDINVDTDEGIVTLFGRVESQRAKDQAAAEVRKISGVREVLNDLQVVSPSQAPLVGQKDDDIEKSIEQRIGAEASLSGSQIAVEVEAGVARLTGTVKSRGEQVTALTLARATPGVRRVIDDLRLVAPSASLR